MTHFLGAAVAGDIAVLVDEALALKNDPHSHTHLGRNRALGLVFMNPSLRTRASSWKAGRLLGMDVAVINAAADGWALEFDDAAVMNGKTVEHIRDAAPVLGQYFDILGLRSFPALQSRADDEAEVVLTQFATHAGVPVVSLESALRHPLQSLADMITIREHRARPRPKVVLTWAPHIKPIPHAVANSFAEWTLAAGYDLTITNPEGLDLDARFTRGATVTHDQQEALRDADFVYVKNWSSYENYGAVYEGGAQWMLTPERLAGAPAASVMHCLPVRRNVEVSSAVLDGPRAIVQAQAGNRVWAAMAVFKRLLEGR